MFHYDSSCTILNFNQANSISTNGKMEITNFFFCYLICVLIFGNDFFTL